MRADDPMKGNALYNANCSARHGAHPDSR